MSVTASTNGYAARSRTRTSELLRIATAGSVDDGKSTLIGRLLHDSKSILEDQLEHVQQTSERRGDGYLNLALLTDGLRAEREQGITIDVAYRYFQTPRRKFIIADTPGHEQYTRNMVTGASTADLSIVLVDARNGVSEQTRRHAYIASLLRIPHVVVCVNKMDLVGYDEDAFYEILEEVTDWAARLQIPDMTFIPISALHGDNVVERSHAMQWYGGAPLLYHLEHVVIAPDRNLNDVRFPVQWVIRPMSEEHHDYRGYAGQVAGGVLRPGDEVVVLPGGQRASIAGIDTYSGARRRGLPDDVGGAAARRRDRHLARRHDRRGRGPAGQRPRARGDDLLDERAADAAARSLYDQAHDPQCARGRRAGRVPGRRQHARARAGPAAGAERDRPRQRCAAARRWSSTPTPATARPGSFILIDEATNDTVGAGMIVDAR